MRPSGTRAFSHQARKKESGAPGETRTPDPLLRSRLSTFIKTCRSERKAAGIQQVVTTSDQLLAPSSSPLSRLFAAISHNSYCVFMTVEPCAFTVDAGLVWPQVEL